MSNKVEDSDWNDLKIFLAVARGGTQAFAAESLGQSQPTVGRRIRALELSLGSSLFHRSVRGLVLTHEGTAVLRNVEQMEIEAQAIRRKLSRQRELSGLLRVSASGWGLPLLAPVFAAFSSRHPQIELQLLGSRSANSLVRHEVDLMYQQRQFDEADIIQRELTQVGYGLYGQLDYLERAGSLTVDGRGHKLLALAGTASDPGHDEWLQSQLSEASTALRTENHEALLQWCRSGVGLALLPRAVGGQYSELRQLTTSAPPPERTIWAGYHRDLKCASRLRALLDATLESLMLPGK